MKPLKEFEEIYITYDGEIYKKKDNSYLKIAKRLYKGHSYQSITIRQKGKSKTYTIHRLVAEYFIPNPENKNQVNHINGDKGDNRIENLEWVTAKENTRHAMKTGLIDIKGENHYLTKLTDQKVKEIRKIYAKGVISQKTLGKMFGVGRYCVQHIVSGNSWKHLL